MANANGESSREARFSCEAARMKTAAIASVKPATKPRLSSPAGMARLAVRGLAASMPASAQRLKAIAAERAETMQTMIQTSLIAGGQPPAASIAPIRAKGSTKIECSHLIISSVVPIFRNRSKAKLPVLVYREQSRSNLLGPNPRVSIHISQVSFSTPGEQRPLAGASASRALRQVQGWLWVPALVHGFSDGWPATWRSFFTLKTPG